MFHFKKAAGLLAASSLLAFGAAGTAVAGTAHAKPAASAACASNCDDISSRILGPDVIVNTYAAGDTGVNYKAGQDINLNQGANNRPNEDVQVEAVGTVGSQCRSIFNPDGILLSNSVLCNTSNGYRNDTAYEVDISPYGSDTGLCAGTTGTPVSGMQVKATECGTTEGTLVVRAHNAAVTANGLTYYTYISGATGSFSHPFVFTVNTGTSHPQNRIQLQQENLVTGQVAATDQLFAVTSGSFN
jgi:hypothetical protein